MIIITLYDLMLYNIYVLKSVVIYNDNEQNLRGRQQT